MKFLNSKKVVPYILVSPFIVTFIVLTLYPAIQAFIMSFQRILPGQTEFIGLSNYRRVLSPTFYTAFQNTTIYVILTTLILVTVPILLAALLNSKATKYSTFYRASLFIPSLASIIVAGTVFRLIFGETDTALANQVITWFGGEPIQWQYQSWSAMFLMVILSSWRWMGVNVMYYLAALQNVPPELYESADIDGASTVQKFFYVTIPHLKPIITFVTTITIINGFRMFEESYVFWEANSPGNIGLSMVGYMYDQGVQRNDMGFGAAIGVIVLIIIFIVSIIQLKFTGAFKRGDE
ncbi:carbohydrate ABC transporter permease [Pelagirhabdus alkalitolerans]|nr:sugar ABC transporter permease [Pelagirhabdus alkalitolerans]